MIYSATGESIEGLGQAVFWARSEKGVESSQSLNSKLIGSRLEILGGYSVVGRLVSVFCSSGIYR